MEPIDGDAVLQRWLRRWREWRARRALLRSARSLTPDAFRASAIREQCDRCPARARVILHYDERRLAFCGHHYHLHEVDLIVQGWLIGLDERGVAE